MDEKEFTSKIAGEVRICLDGVYPYFKPNDLPFDLAISEDLRRKSMTAAVNLARLDGRSAEMPPSERDNFLKAFSLKESAHSSSIEGTRSTLDDLYRFEKETPDQSHVRDAKEVTNYKNALEMGITAISSGSEITAELLSEMHKVLMKGARGENKSPGMFKKEQNAIGNVGDTLETAKMVPAPPEYTEHLMDNLLDYIKSEEDPLIKISLAHYQFESIHPYRDGNGRIGRLLIMLMLAKEDILHYAMIYPSEYFDRRRDEYIDRLFNVSAKDQFEEWIGFFLDALNEQALDSIRTIDCLESYKKELKDRFNSTNEYRLIDMLFSNPYVRSKDVEEQCHVSNPTAVKMLANLETHGVLREVSGKKRNLLYSADGILEILTGRHR